MQTETRPFYKSVLFWGITGGALVFIAALTVLLILLLRPDPLPPPAPTSPTLPPATAATEPTLPPSTFDKRDFIHRNGYITCTSAPCVLGIDVSEWQEEIDWAQVKAAGVEFVMLRAGWRGSEQGLLFEDTLAQEHYAGASAAGLKIGAYFFSQAASPEEAAEEANFLLDIIDGWNIEMPVVFDWEYVSADSRTAAMTPRLVTDCARIFCDRVAAAGYTPTVYFNLHLSEEYLLLTELTDYPFWLAQYTDAPEVPYRIDLWQYTDSGTVPGIAGGVDINLYFPR